MSELPEGWVRTTIGAVTRPVRKHRPDRKPDTEFTYIDISSIDNESNLITSPKYIAGRKAPSRARQLVATGDIVLSTVRVYLKNTAPVPAALDGATASTGFCVLRPTVKIDPRFLLHTVFDDEFVSDLSTRQTGTSYPAVRDDNVREMEVRLPPLAEQRRIVTAIEALFDRLDSARDSLQNSELKLVQLRASILQSALSKEVPHRKLLEVCEKPQYGWTTRSKQNGKPLRLLRITDIQNGTVDWSSVPRCENEPPDRRKFLLEPGDILVARSGATVGKSILIRKAPPSIFASYLIRIRTRRSLLPEYLALFFNSTAYWEQITSAHSGIAQPNVNARKLENITLPVPSVADQERIVREVEQPLLAAEATSKAIDCLLARAAELRQSILRRALAGRLIPQDSADEPAEVFLRRIQTERTAG